MNPPIRFKGAAGKDVENARNWYDEQSPGLGEEFLDEVDATVSRILDNPHSHQVIRGRIRRAVLHRFPYFIFYVVDPREIVVLACMHASRDPHSWPSSNA